MVASSVAALVLMPRPQMVTREEWGAKPVLPSAKRHSISRITLHHGGVKSNPGRTLEDKLRGLQAWSQRADKLASGKDKPAWPDIPYHYYIDVSGRVGEARPVHFAGDTNTEYDPAGHLLIVLEGDFNQEEVGAAQYSALLQLGQWCAWSWGVPVEKIGAHDDYSSQTSCPGKNLKALLPAMKAKWTASLAETRKG
jgi:hypothetical protein